MKLVEKLADIASLRAEPRPCRVDDRRIQSQTLRDVDSRRRSRNSDLQFVGGLQRNLIEADRGVDDARSIRAVDFQRRVMR